MKIFTNSNTENLYLTCQQVFMVEEPFLQFMQNPFRILVMIASVTDVEDRLTDVEKLTQVEKINKSDALGETVKYI